MNIKQWGLLAAPATLRRLHRTVLAVLVAAVTVVGLSTLPAAAALPGSGAFGLKTVDGNGADACVAAVSDGTVTLETCNLLQQRQEWVYSTGGNAQTIRNVLVQKCVTTTSPLTVVTCASVNAQQWVQNTLQQIVNVGSTNCWKSGTGQVLFTACPATVDSLFTFVAVPV